MNSPHSNSGEVETKNVPFSVEWYTQGKYADMAREVMGSIDLDPFSCEEANKNIKATNFYTEQDNGFIKPWFGNVWTNHPFGVTTNRQFSKKIKIELTSGRVTQIISVSFMGEGWFREFLKQIQCFPDERIKYIKNGRIEKQPMKYSVFTYFGPNKERFKEVFSRIGVVK